MTMSSPGFARSATTLGLDHLQALVADRAGVPGIERGLLGHPRRRAADVERAHRQLRARLADRLRRDDADRETQLDQPAGREVAPQQHFAQQPRRLAQVSTERIRTFSMPPSWIARRLLLVDLLVDVDDQVPAERIDDLLERDTADDAVAQRLDDLARFDDRPGLDAVHRAAVDPRDDHVLRDVHETPRQVARVGGLERRVGQPLRAPCVEMSFTP